MQTGLHARSNTDLPMVACPFLSGAWKEMRCIGIVILLRHKGRLVLVHSVRKSERTSSIFHLKFLLLWPICCYALDLDY